MRSKRALVNIITALLAQVVTLVCGLIAPRLILYAFGSKYYGVCASITQFLSMISLLTLGLAGAVRVELYKTLAADDIDGTSKVVRATDRYMKKVSLGILLYVVLLMIVYPAVANTEISQSESVLLIAIISISSFVQYFVGVTYINLLIADQRQYVQSIMTCITSALYVLITAVLIRYQCSVFVVKLAASIVYSISPVVFKVYCSRRYKLNMKCEAHPDVLKQRGASAFHSIANIIHDNTDIIVLSIFLDIKTVAVYSVYNLVTKSIREFKNSFTNGLEAAFGNMWVKREYTVLQRNFRYYETMIGAFVIVVFSCMGMMVIPFVTLYTRNITDTNYIIPVYAALITIGEAIYTFRQPYVTLVQATGNYEATKFGAAIEGLLNIVTSIILVFPFGICGVAIGTLLANLFRTIQYAIFISRNILDRPFLEIVKRLLWVVFSVTVVVRISYSFLNIVTNIFTYENWLVWFLSAVGVFVISLGVVLISTLFFYRSDLVGIVKMGCNIFANGGKKFRRKY